MSRSSSSAAEPAPSAPSAEHRARLRPFAPETVWSLEGDHLVERRGRSQRRLPLSRLRGVRLVGGVATLSFGLARVTIPARSYGRGLALEDRRDSFEAFMRRISAPAPAVLGPGPVGPAGGGLLAAGVVAAGLVLLLAAGAVSGEYAIALDFGARLAFVLILAAAVLPWLSSSRGTGGER